MSLVQHKLTLCSHLRPLLVVRDSKTVVEKIYVRSGTEGRESPHVPCGESKSRINVVIEAQGPCVLGFHQALPLMLSLFAKLCPRVPSHWSPVIWGLAFPVSCSSPQLLLLMASGLFKLENTSCETSVSCSDPVVPLCPHDSTRRLSTACCHPGCPALEALGPPACPIFWW